jgi:hypothetical protein
MKEFLKIFAEIGICQTRKLNIWHSSAKLATTYVVATVAVYIDF